MEEGRKWMSGLRRTAEQRKQQFSLLDAELAEHLEKLNAATDIPQDQNQNLCLSGLDQKIADIDRYRVEFFLSQADIDADKENTTKFVEQWQPMIVKAHKKLVQLSSQRRPEARRNITGLLEKLQLPDARLRSIMQLILDKEREDFQLTADGLLPEARDRLDRAQCGQNLRGLQEAVRGLQQACGDIVSAFQVDMDAAQQTLSAQLWDSAVGIVKQELQAEIQAIRDEREQTDEDKLQLWVKLSLKIAEISFEIAKFELPGHRNTAADFEQIAVEVQGYKAEAVQRLEATESQIVAAKESVLREQPVCVKRLREMLSDETWKAEYLWTDSAQDSDWEEAGFAFKWTRHGLDLYLKGKNIMTRVGVQTRITAGDTDTNQPEFQLRSNVVVQDGDPERPSLILRFPRKQQRDINTRMCLRLLTEGAKPASTTVPQQAAHMQTGGEMESAKQFLSGSAKQFLSVADRLGLRWTGERSRARSSWF